VCREVELDEKERPRTGEPLPQEGCNVELTEITDEGGWPILSLILGGRVARVSPASETREVCGRSLGECAPDYAPRKNQFQAAGRRRSPERWLTDTHLPWSRTARDQDQPPLVPAVLALRLEMCVVVIESEWTGRDRELKVTGGQPRVFLCPG